MRKCYLELVSSVVSVLLVRNYGVFWRIIVDRFKVTFQIAMLLKEG